MTYDKENIVKARLKGHPDDNAKALYVDWLRGNADKPDQEILDHVADCEQCKSEILETAGLLDALDQDDKLHKQKNRLLIIRSVAALLVVFIVAMMIEFLRPDNDKVEVAGIHADSLLLEGDTIIIADSLKPNKADTGIIREEIIIVHDTIKYAANFVSNPSLDVLLNANFRSDQVVVHEEWPKDTVMMRGSKLTLLGGEGIDEKAEIVLLSNKNVVIVSEKFDNKKVTLKMNVEPGLYYWKVLAEDKLISIGRVRIFSSAD